MSPHPFTSGISQAPSVNTPLVRDPRSAPLRLSQALVSPAWAKTSWRLHDSNAAKALEQAAAALLPPHTLMQRAGRSVARLALAVAPHAQKIHILVGPGNNGGDGYEAAVHLHQAGKAVCLHAIGHRDSLPADAGAARDKACAAGVNIVHGLDSVGLAHADLLIDALLGRGLTRPAEGILAEAMTELNRHNAPVLAVDIPSGLPADTGTLASAQTPCVRAHWTLALLTLAPGLFTGQGRDHSGEVWWDDLGVDLHHPQAPAPAALLNNPAELNAHALRRQHAHHKGSFGDVWVVGGAASMSGAVSLAGRAALRAGAGRVYVHALDVDAPRLDPLHPELMFAPGEHLLHPEAPWHDVTVVAGCGGGDAIRTVLPRLLDSSIRLVLDADALNALASEAHLRTLLRTRAGRGQTTVLTPHPLEAARLLGCRTVDVQADRLRAARSLAHQSGAWVVLKGSGSLIAPPHTHAPWINTSGNAALATPGSGDVLAGWLGGLWSQYTGTALDTHETSLQQAQRAVQAATRQAVHAHGACAEHLSPEGHVVLASQLRPSNHHA